MEGDGSGHAAGVRDLTAAGRCVPALRAGSVGTGLAEGQAPGDVVVVRYADDIVAGFEHRADAERFLQEWQERLAEVRAGLHPDKPD